MLQFPLHKKPVLSEKPAKKTPLHFGFLQLQQPKFMDTFGKTGSNIARVLAVCVVLSICVLSESVYHRKGVIIRSLMLYSNWCS